VGNRYDLPVSFTSEFSADSIRLGYWVRPVILLAPVQDGGSCEMQIIEKANVFVDFKMLGVSTFHHVCLLETYVSIVLASQAV
jgi:hypothetical protein